MQGRANFHPVRISSILGRGVKKRTDDPVGVIYGVKALPDGWAVVHGKGPSEVVVETTRTEQEAERKARELAKGEAAK